MTFVFRNHDCLRGATSLAYNDFVEAAEFEQAYRRSIAILAVAGLLIVLPGIYEIVRCAFAPGLTAPAIAESSMLVVDLGPDAAAGPVHDAQEARGLQSQIFEVNR